MDGGENMKLSDVARMAGVSITAAGKVLHGGSSSIRVGAAARERILRAAKESGYRQNMTASILAGGNSKLIGIMIDSRPGYRNSRIATEFERICAGLGYRIITCSSHDSFENIREDYWMLQSYGVAGVVCLAHEYPQFQERMNEFFAGKKNIVYVERPSFDAECYVATSRKQALEDFIRDSLTHGRGRIGLLCGNRIYSSERDLLNSFREACEKLRHRPEPELIDDGVLADLTEVDEPCFRRIMDFVRKAKPDCLYVDDAFNAVVLQTRLVQERMKVTIQAGNSDPLLAMIRPAIRSFDPRYGEIAEKLVELAIRKNFTGTETIDSLY